MKKHMKAKNERNRLETHNEIKRTDALTDIFIAARLAFLGLLIALNNALFNFIYFSGQRKVKTTYFVKLTNKFANCCALSFNRLESKLSFKRV